MLTRFIAVLFIFLSVSTSVYAADTSGEDLLELLAATVEQESAKLQKQGEIGRDVIPVFALVPGSAAEAQLADEFDRHLAKAFTLLWLQPDEKTLDLVVHDLYYVFLKHAGSGVLNSESTPELLKTEIRRFVKPRRERQSKSCIAYLSNNHSLEKIH